MTSRQHQQTRFPRGRRTGASAVTAALILLLAVAVGYLLVCVALRRNTIGVTIDNLRGLVTETSWNNPVVLYLGIVVGLLGVAVLSIAILPASRNVVELKNPDARIAAVMPKQSLRRTVRSAAIGVDGISDAEAKIGRRRIRLTVTTGLRHTSTLPSSTERAVSSRLRVLDLARPRALGVRLTRKEV